MAMQPVRIKIRLDGINEWIERARVRIEKLKSLPRRVTPQRLRTEMQKALAMRSVRENGELVIVVKPRVSSKRFVEMLIGEAA